MSEEKDSTFKQAPGKESLEESNAFMKKNTLPVTATPIRARTDPFTSSKKMVTNSVIFDPQNISKTPPVTPPPHIK
jgi:hypothetical protein